MISCNINGHTFKQSDHNTNRISDLKNHLKLAGYSHKTQKAYLGHVTRFHSYIGKDLDYLNVLDTRIDVIKIPRPKKESKLPKVIGENTVIKILKALENEKHKKSL